MQNRWIEGIKKGNAPFLAIILLAVGIAFFPSINNEFINFDDGKLILYNKVVSQSNYSSIDGVSDALQTNFSTFYKMAHYKPLVFTAWGVLFNLGGKTFNSVYFHLFNWILHLINCGLVFLIAMQLLPKLLKDSRRAVFPWLALFIALFFGLNPLKVESVAWATELKDVLYGMFYLAAWYLFNKTLGAKNKPKILMLIGGSSLLFVCALLSKSMAITLPGVLLLSMLLWSADNIKQWVRLVPFILIALFFAINVYDVFGFSGASVATDIGLVEMGLITTPENLQNLPSFYQYLLSGSFRFLFWLGHLLFPAKLAINYPRVEFIESLGMAVHLLLPLIGALIFMAIKARKKAPWLIYALGLFIIALLPAFLISEQGISTFVSDRYTYVASIGVSILTVLGLYHLVKSKFQPVAIGCVAITLLFGIKTYQYTMAWRTSETLWTAAIDSYPTSPVVASLGLWNRGLYYRQQADLQKQLGNLVKSNAFYRKALKDYDESLRMQPGNYEVYINRGKIYFDQGRALLQTGQSNQGAKFLSNAIKDFTKYIEHPNTMNKTLAYANRGVANGQLGNMDAALADMNTAQHLSPEYAEGYRNRGVFYMTTNRFADAISDFERYLTYEPSSAGVHCDIGVAWQHLNDHNAAIPYFNQAISLNNSNKDYYYNRAISLTWVGAYDKGKMDIQKCRALGKEKSKMDALENWHDNQRKKQQ